MSLSLCEISFQQTQELLRLTDMTLQHICCKRFTSEELYVEALQKVLGGQGKRGPCCIFIIFQDTGGNLYRGRAFQVKDGALIEMSQEITIYPDDTYAINLAKADAVLSNWCDMCETVEKYQESFHPGVRAFVIDPIKNFVCYRISGKKPGAIIAFNYPEEATAYDADVLRSLAVVIGSVVTLSDELRETEQAFIYTIEALARACEAAEESTGRHILRVNRYAEALAMHMDLPDDFVEAISYSAQMHDVGKIKVSVSILLKEGPLDVEELKIMMMHPVYGKKILGDAPRLQIARDIAIAHHENWDGSGYPYGLQGDAIPLAGRIVKLADVYDALRSKRSYKPALSHEEVLAVFRDGDERIRPDAHFDPVVSATFFRIEQQFERIYEKTPDGFDMGDR